MTSEQLKDLAMAWLDDLKAQDLLACDVRKKTSIADFFIIATGTSTRHVKALANEVIQEAKDAGYTPFGSEGFETSEWILVDLGDVVVHIMQAATREFYDLESLWLTTPAQC